VLLVLTGCAREDLLHDLTEPEANRILMALEEEGIRGEKASDETTESRWKVVVRKNAASAARRVLADHGLPRSRTPGFDEILAKGGMISTAAEERALLLHALAGELARTVQAIEGVIDARVHLTLPETNRWGAAASVPPSASVLVRCRPGAAQRLQTLEGGIRTLVSGAVGGLTPSAVSVLVAEAEQPASKAIPAEGQPPPRRRLATVSALSAAAAIGCLAVALLARRRGTGGGAHAAR
jgi:type III secretion protein J